MGIKLRDAWAFSSDPRDPEAVFFARLLYVFGGEFIGVRPSPNVEDTEPTRATISVNC